MKKRTVDIDKIGIPDVRVTSSYDAALEEELRSSIKEMGMLDPVSLVQVDGKLVLVDGLHRVMAAKALGLEKVPAIVLEGEMRENLLMNMVLNRMRGKTKPSHLVHVVEALQHEYDMSPDEIEKATGLSKGYLSQLRKVADAGEGLKAMVDRGELDVTRAYHVAKIPDPATQDFVADQVVHLKMPREETKAFVSSVMAELEKPKKERVPLEEMPVGTAECRVCHAQFRPGEMLAPIVCHECWGSMLALYGGAAARAAPQIE